ncbi:unnamed protein product [Microthlaspi erraticum]|uniref:C3H1-type domain-containing protein n=1 Tax=Microthlaspi erraticum TaxID=1685480 RepID=A0A6D2KJ68_9BRAS|nr:unnamed protein product [Microthlaspi erraticum]
MMSGWGTKHVSKWDSKEDTQHHLHRSSVNVKPASYYRDKEPPETACFNAESNGSRSRVAENNDDNYYSEPDETRQQPYFHRSGSSSISRSRSPVYRYRARRDAGSYDRHQTSRGFSRSSGYNCVRKPREMQYDSDDFREHAVMKGARSSGYDTDGVSDPRLRRYRSELTEERDTQRRYGYGDGEAGEFRRSSNIPCKFFAGGAGFCRNGNHCRFSHHVLADRNQPQDNNYFYGGDSYNHSGHNRWNDVERLDNGIFGGKEVSRASKGVPEAKGNGSSWIDDMEMSPDWNYGVRSLKNPVNEEHGGVGQSLQSRLVKDNLVSNYDQKSNGMFSYGDKPTVEAALHQNFNKPAAPVQAFNHNVLQYQNGGSQQVLVGSKLREPESGNVYQNSHQLMVEKAVPVTNTVPREQMDQISNMAASIAQFLAKGQSIPNLRQALQMPLHSESSMAVLSNQATTALRMMSSSNPNQLCGLGTSTGAEGVPVVTEENGDKKTETSKEEDGKKIEQDRKDEVADEDGSDEENKKGKDQMAFKFALVEIVKELLKPAWKDGKMNKDGYKNIVKKVVEKVTGTMQTGNVPQTQEEIVHYLSSSKPKLTNLVQAYISQVKKN